MFYVNFLSWNKRIDEALNIINELEINDEILLIKAKLLFWNDNLEESMKIYLALKNRSIDIGENGKKAIELFDNKKQEKLLLEYNQKIIIARKLSQENKMDEANKIYDLLIKNHFTKEVLLDYTNMLAWNKKTKKAIDTIEKFEKKDNDIYLQLGKFYFWNNQINKAYKLVMELESNGFETGKTGIDIKNKIEENMKNEKQKEINKKIIIARNLSREGKYIEASKFYDDDLLKLNRKEVNIDYINLLNWSNQPEKVIIFIEKNKLVDTDYKHLLAKSYFYKNEIDKSYEIYKKLKNNNVTLDETGIKVIKIIENPEKIDKFNIKYSYISDLFIEEISEIPALFFTYTLKENLKFVLWSEFYFISTKYENMLRALDIYYNNLFFTIGQSKSLQLMIGGDLYIKNFTLGCINYNYDKNDLDSTLDTNRLNFYLKYERNIKKINLGLKTSYDYVSEKQENNKKNSTSDINFNFFTSYKFLKLNCYFDKKKYKRSDIDIKMKEFFGIKSEIGLYKNYESNFFGYKYSVSYSF